MQVTEERARLGEFRVLVEGLDHPEGVAVSADGRRVYAGGEAGQVYRYDVEADVLTEVGSTGGFLLGVALDASERVYCCDIRRREVLRVDPSNGRVDVYSRGTADRPMINPNWGVFDAAGNYYVTDSGTWHGDDGCIFRVTPGGETTVWSEASSNFPNGCALDLEGTALLVLESCTPALVRIPIGADGAAGAREVVTELPGTVPDGVGLDTDGNSYVCCYRPDVILRVTPGGEVTTVAADPEGTMLAAPTNCAWFGESHDQFVCGNLGRWHLATADLGARGLGLHFPELS